MMLPSVVGQFLPDFLGNKGHDGMKQDQDLFQHSDARWLGP